MKSQVVKRSVIIAGHETSVSLEDAFWNSLKNIADERQMTLSDLVAAINSQRQHNNLSSALRLYVLNFYCANPNKKGRDKRNWTSTSPRAREPRQGQATLDEERTSPRRLRTLASC